jgi:hypothetical protein
MIVTARQQRDAAEEQMFTLLFGPIASRRDAAAHPASRTNGGEQHE